MNEMMIDLETKDTIPSAVILSLGAVVWTTRLEYEPDILVYDVVERFYRCPKVIDQEMEGRTQSIQTMSWWNQQDADARAEAFVDEKLRCHIESMWRDLMLLAASHGVTRFWASPCTFDFPILNDFQRMFGLNAIWSYNQMYDVRTVVLEASYSVHEHVLTREIAGKAHMPVTDCEYQIDLLTAARSKLKRRMGS